MTIREQVLQNMDTAFREDRERFFAVADTMMFQPKYETHMEEVNELKQKWRDAPQQEDYPNITHPMALPDWFPRVPFASCWEKDIYIAQELERIAQAEAEQEGFNENAEN